MVGQPECASLDRPRRGAAGLDVLAAATEAGAATFSVHPLQTFPDGVTDLTGCPCAISGSDDEALSYARALAERLGMRLNPSLQTFGRARKLLAECLGRRKVDLGLELA